uniref:RRM domain-containing protein n=1 Tax=Compsopogon caeruleus TaxID=31354 RepID=A0A7S1TG53_9RHOD
MADHEPRGGRGRYGEDGHGYESGRKRDRAGWEGGRDGGGGWGGEDGTTNRATGDGGPRRRVNDAEDPIRGPRDQWRPPGVVAAVPLPSSGWPDEDINGGGNGNGGLGPGGVTGDPRMTDAGERYAVGMNLSEERARRRNPSRSGEDGRTVENPDLVRHDDLRDDHRYEDDRRRDEEGTRGGYRKQEPPRGGKGGEDDRWKVEGVGARDDEWRAEGRPEMGRFRDEDRAADFRTYDGDHAAPADRENIPFRDRTRHRDRHDVERDRDRYRDRDRERDRDRSRGRDYNDRHAGPGRFESEGDMDHYDRRRDIGGDRYHRDRDYGPDLDRLDRVREANDVPERHDRAREVDRYDRPRDMAGGGDRYDRTKDIGNERYDRERDLGPGGNGVDRHDRDWDVGGVGAARVDRDRGDFGGTRQARDKENYGGGVDRFDYGRDGTGRDVEGDRTGSKRMGRESSRHADSHGEQRNTLFVANLPFTLTKEDLRGLFEGYGPTHYVKVGQKPNGMSTGTGWVAFINEGDAARALEEMHKKNVHGRDIVVEFARTKERKFAEARDRGLDRDDRRDRAGHRDGGDTDREDRFDPREDNHGNRENHVDRAFYNGERGGEGLDDNDGRDGGGDGRKSIRRSPAELQFVMESLPFGASNDTITEAVNHRIPSYVRLTILPSHEPGKNNKGLAFVEMKSANAVETALDDLNAHPLEIEGRTIHVRRYTSEGRRRERVS